MLQTALVKLYVAWPRLHRDGREEAYVRQIIVRANIDEHRRPWHRERATDAVPDRPTPSETSVEERRTDQRPAAAAPMQRNAVVLRHWLGLSTRDTAMVGISEGTVKSHTSRGLERLFTLLRGVEMSWTSTEMVCHPVAPFGTTSTCPGLGVAGLVGGPDLEGVVAGWASQRYDHCRQRVDRGLGRERGFAQSPSSTRTSTLAMPRVLRPRDAADRDLPGRDVRAVARARRSATRS